MNAILNVTFKVTSGPTQREVPGESPFQYISGHLLHATIHELVHTSLI